MKIFLCLFWIYFGIGFQSHDLSREEVMENIFHKHQATGTFVLYFPENEEYVIYDHERAQKPLLPASTFKIPNSLIILETGVVANQEEILKWDGKDHGSSGWNQDQSLRTAFKRSAVWAYQHWSRQVGEARMQEWLDNLNYGNRNIGGGVDRFWLDGELRVTPLQQIEFLKKLRENELPVSRKNMEIVKAIMTVEKGKDFILRAKTGWADVEDVDYGWYVGWIEKDNKPVYFAMNMDILKAEDAPKRIEITREILKELGLM